MFEKHFMHRKVSFIFMNWLRHELCFAHEKTAGINPAVMNCG